MAFLAKYALFTVFTLLLQFLPQEVQAKHFTAFLCSYFTGSALIFLL